MSGPKYLRMLLIGNAKQGKTTCAITTAPEGGVYVITSDLGASTAYPQRKGRPFDESPLVDAPQKLENALKVAIGGATEGKYSTVIWDTVTSYARHIEDLELAASPNNSQRAYGEMGRRVMSGIKRLIKNLPAHLVVIDHTKVDDDGEIVLDMSGRAKTEIANQLDDIWQFRCLKKSPWQAILSRKAPGICNSRTVPDDCVELPADINELYKRMQQ